MFTRTLIIIPFKNLSYFACMKNFYLKRWDEAVIWKSGFCRRVKYIYFFKFKVKTVNWKGSIEALFFLHISGGRRWWLHWKAEHLNNLWLRISFSVYDKAKSLTISIFVVWFEGLSSYKSEITMLKIFSQILYQAF